MKVQIQSIPHRKQRYNTCGDWYNKGGILHIKVSKTRSDYDFLIAIHEFVEAYLCKKQRIRESQVTKFDINFKGLGEPGDDKKAPYYDQHQIASDIERRLAYFMGIDWDKYEKTINSL